MIINWKVWSKAETGGVIISLLISLGFFFFILLKSINHYQETHEEIQKANKQINTVTAQLDTIESYEKLTKQEPQKFRAFKRKKWMSLLTLNEINEALYALQKKSNASFIFIHPKNISDANNILKAELSLNIQVLRDQHFFNFLQKLESELPGIVKIKKYELKRTKELNQQIAKKIHDGEKICLFEGNIDFEIEYMQLHAQHPTKQL